ncbi:glutamate-1-semialdehyde 2,1-aminomutase [Leptospira ryugenii]|uniref:glutamate-1-semialdehyde 2,1-aminomutase n=1 Tax=Leptospira ryugenii TaxID=1917863 RepID=UPI000D5907DD|nr:glutamate-1-semialdehyde 2,1-aminomutase [Leptospira ryugenii]
MSSHDLFQRSLKVAPGGVHSPVRSFQSVGGNPIFFERSKGAYLWDVEGKRYIDFCQSFGPLLFGHRDPEIQEIVLDTIERTWTLGACEPYSLELAEFIIQHIPWVEKIRFVNSGTEAVMSALRVARAATGRAKVLKFEGCYHGHLDSLLVKAGSGLAGESASDSAGIPKELIQNTFVLSLDEEDELEEFFSEHGTEIAAIAIEPLPANYGLLPQRKSFLQKLRSLATKFGCVLIFDEVITGFRIGFTGMSGRLGISPDLVCYGKIIGGGFPVGAYAGKASLMDLVSPSGKVYQAGTLSANPIGMRAGLKTLQKAFLENPYSALSIQTETWSNELVKSLNETSEFTWKTQSLDSLFWLVRESGKEIRKISEIPSSLQDDFKTIFHPLLQKGVYLPPSPYEVGFLSTAHTKEILDETISLVKTLL